jgi:hypothetical protein
MNRHFSRHATLSAVLLALFAGGAALAQEARQSTTGPTPPPGVVAPPLSGAKSVVQITGVPPYLWRHGCGPTAVGMVLGYWDGKGFDDLIPGSAASETVEVTQAIASGGSSSSPSPTGTPQHYEDYCRPEDSRPTLVDDEATTLDRMPHSDNCIADFMLTSRSTALNYYGWSWSSDVIPAFNGYVSLRSRRYAPTAHQYNFGASLTFDLVKREIDAGRPMVFIVDSSGDGETDHLVAVIGYNDGPPQTFIYYDTWDLVPHESEFRGMSDTYQWGVWAGWSFSLKNNFVFLSEPESGTMKEGESLSWTVEVEGAVGEPSYQWFKSSAPIQGRKDRTFSIESLTWEDSGWYECQVTDGTGTVMRTQSAHLSVKKLNAIPAAGNAALIFTVLLCALIGVRRLRGA